MKKTDETTPSAPDANDGPRKRPITRRAFKNFAEYWHFTKDLPEYQRKLLVNSMSRIEQKALKASYDKGGWFDLFMRNQCDEILDQITKETGVDLIQVRIKTLSGKPQLMHRTFWEYINERFQKVSFEHIAYIFDDIIVKEHDEDYIKLMKYVPED